MKMNGKAAQSTDHIYTVCLVYVAALVFSLTADWQLYFPDPQFQKTKDEA